MAPTPLQLTTPHGPIAAFLAEPQGQVRGGIVIAHEIFGLTPQIERVAQRWAEEGYIAIAPALFDMVETGAVLPYDEDGLARGRTLAQQLGFGRAVEGMAAAADALRERGVTHIGVIGFCWGGTAAYLANTRLRLPAASYYGSRTVPFLNEALRAPMLFHCAGRDEFVPMADVHQTRERKPEAAMYVYDEAGHAFARDGDTHYVEAAATLADERTREFMRQALA